LRGREIKLFKKFIISVFLIVFVFANVFAVSAAAIDSFLHSDSIGGVSTSIAAREMYTVSKTLTAATLGIDESLQGITDICCGNDGIVYILCGESSRLIVLNSDYTFNKELSIVNTNGEVDFTGARGIFVDKDNNIYIADSQNARVLVCGQDGIVKNTWNIPDSSLIPEDFVYSPVSVSMDPEGYTYILSLGSFYGALSYDPEGEFLGFYGANRVNATGLDTISALWNRLTKNDEKRAASVKTMPYSFTDLVIDDEGFMITCTGQIKNKTGKGQIRKLSPNGQDILNKRLSNGDSIVSSSVNFLENGNNKRQGDQNFCSLAVDSEGFIYGLEDRYGLIYVYDKDCNLVNGFGGGMQRGIQAGTFHTPVSLAVNGTSVIVADKYNCSVTVFEITSYGKVLREAHTMYINGDYTDAEACWKEVLASDRGNQVAYRGLAMASYSRGDYKTSLNYAKSGLDYTVYDLAWQALIKEFISQNFALLVVGAAIVVVGIVVAIIIVKRKKKEFITNNKLKTVLSVPFHPFNSFEEVKYKNRGSLITAVVLLFLLYIGFVLKSTASGFLYLQVSPQNFNMLYTMAQTIGLVLLWSVSNWLVCSMFSGKGRFKDVFIVTVYSLIPMIVYIYISVILSHFLPLSGVEFLGSFQTVIWIYTFFLLSIGLMTVHEYDFFKLMLTSVVVLFLMLMIIFILFMFYMFMGQVVDFVYSIYDEIAFR
jgi:hypothetical protein